MHSLGWRFAALALTLGLGSTLAAAQAVGEVEFAHGAATAQTGTQAPRAMGKGLVLNQGDRLTTADGSSAIFKLQDGTRMTLRPNSEMVVKTYNFVPAAESNSMVLQLLRGGLRAVTGLISKGSPDAAKIQTSTATIGIRGTDFDARICAADCKAESSQLAQKLTQAPHENTVKASAKLAASHGEVSVLDDQGRRRRVVDGGSVYAGETVETAGNAGGVLVFRDDSRMTLGAGTLFKIDTFVFDAKNPAEGKFLLSLIRGSLRALTGLIGKADHNNVRYATPTATVGVRGTGLDLDCGSGASCSIFTWLGTIEVTPNGQTALQVLEAGQGLLITRDSVTPISASTIGDLPRPDEVPVNFQKLFGTGGVSGDEEGLFVYVRDGHIEVVTDTDTLELGRGETGFAGPQGETGRPVDMPLFIQFDVIPMPNSANPTLADLFNSFGFNNICR